MDLLFVGKLTTGRPRRKIRESSKLHVEIDYSGRKSPALADVSYVPKERISHDIHHRKKLLIASKKNDLPTGNIFESENSLRFTFNVSLGGKTALKKVNGLF